MESGTTWSPAPLTDNPERQSPRSTDQLFADVLRVPSYLPSHGNRAFLGIPFIPTPFLLTLKDH